MDARAYIKQTGAHVKIVHIQQYHFINLHLTDVCNLKCYGCNRYCDSAPSSDRMTIGQVRRFVNESIDTAWPWVELRLAGGEPCLHPEFEEILSEISRLKRHLPNMVVKVLTNGKGKRVNDRLKMVPDDFLTPRSTPQKDKSRPVEVDGIERDIIPEFGNVFLAPVDRIESIGPVISTCQIHGTCGIELTRYGYVPCGCGGPRIYGEDLFVRLLKDINQEWCDDALSVLCALCGRNLNYNVTFSESADVSKFWREALAEYAISKPDFPLYPEAK